MSGEVIAYICRPLKPSVNFTANLDCMASGGWRSMSVCAVWANDPGVTNPEVPMFTSISNRFNTLLLMLLVLMAGTIIAILATRSSAGPLDPAGPVASTLPQVEPRSPIPPVGWDGSSPITIGSAGSYFLTRNLTQVPITITAENVTFDLSGFTLSVGGLSVNINVTAGTKRHIVIRNGTLVGGIYGINLEDATRSTLSDLHISGATGTGVRMASGNVVLRVNSSNNSGWGMMVNFGGDYGGSIDESNFSGNGGFGLSLGGNNFAVRNSVSDANGGFGIVVGGSWNDIADSRVVGNGTNGFRIIGNRNVVVRNHIDGNAAAQILDLGAGNIIAPISPATGTNPAGNIGFP